MKLSKLIYELKKISLDNFNGNVEMMQYVILNGPNLNLTGIREPEIYGNKTFDSLMPELREVCPDSEVILYQSNSEGEIIDLIHKYGLDNECGGIIINPGAYSHYSLAIADAIRSIKKRVVEVHLSNIHAREQIRRQSITAEAAKGIISGFGLDGYKLALIWLSAQQREPKPR